MITSSFRNDGSLQYFELGNNALLFSVVTTLLITPEVAATSLSSAFSPVAAASTESRANCFWSRLCSRVQTSDSIAFNGHITSKHRSNEKSRWGSPVSRRNWLNRG